MPNRSFEEEWPDLSRSLERMLRGKGLDPRTAEDVVQETGLRLFRNWGQVDLSRPLIPFAATIAFNLMRDEIRAQHWRSFSEVPERSSTDDVERSTIARLDLHRAARAMRSLSPSYRDALLGDVVEDRVGPLPPSIKMARMRARRKLTAILGTASSLWGWFLRRAESYAQPAANAFLAATIVASAGFIGVQGSGPPHVSHDGTQSALKTAGAAGRRTREPARPRLAAIHRLRIQPKSSQSPAQSQTRRPVRVPLPGAGDAKVAAHVQAGELVIEVGESDGPIPACVGGLGHRPHDLECEDTSTDS